MYVFIIIAIVLILLIIYYLHKEKFISFMQNELSEYGNTPWIILVKYIELDYSKYNFVEYKANNKMLTIVEIFNDYTYKVYSDDALVREGSLPEESQKIINSFAAISDKYVNQSFCDFKGDLLTKYYIIIDGEKIDLGIYGNCVPSELLPMKELYNLMIFSDISR